MTKSDWGDASMRRMAENDKKDAANERAVSDVISFTLMFSIIIIGVGLVSIAGLSQLVTLSEIEEIESADRGMTSTAATLDDMNRHGDMNRSFSVAFANSNVLFNESTELEIDVDSGSYEDTIEMSALEQRFDRDPESVSAVYEGGASFRSDGGFASYDPAITCGGEDTAIISVVNLQLNEDGLSVSAGSDSTFTLDEQSVPTEAPISSFDQELNFDADLVDVDTTRIDDADEVTLDVSGSSQPDQWGNQLDQRGQWDKSGNELTCTSLDDGTVLVRVTTIELTIVTPRFTS